MPETIDLRNAEAGSPEWWLRRLFHQLEARRPDMERWDAYYRGEHPLSFFDDAVRDVFSGRFRRFASNFAALVVDGLAERIEVSGFRFRDESGDDDLWAIWQENDLDGGSQMATVEALIKCGAYTLVEPRGENIPPRITVEDPIDCIVALDPRDRRRRQAALKRWIDDDARLVVVIYMPDWIYTYRSAVKWPDRLEGWPTAAFAPETPVPAIERYELPDDRGWPIRNPMGVVPIVPLPNRPRLKSLLGRSEIEVIASNQDLINYYRVMAVIGARYHAYPQRWIKNLEIEIDKLTGLPKAPFRNERGPADIWQIEPYPQDDPRASMATSQAEFGQFPASDISPFTRLIESEVQAMAAVSRMPEYMLLGTTTSLPAAAEQTKTSEAGLIRKVTRAEVFFGEGWEETMRVALRAMRDERADLRTAETRWVNPETRNEAVRTDSVTKQHTAGIIDDELALEELGYSPEQIRRLQARKRAAGAPEQPTPTSPAPVVPAPTGPRMSPVRG